MYDAERASRVALIPVAVVRSRERVARRTGETPTAGRVPLLLVPQLQQRPTYCSRFRCLNFRFQFLDVCQLTLGAVLANQHSVEHRTSDRHDAVAVVASTLSDVTTALRFHLPLELKL